MEALPGLPTSSCFCSRPLTAATVPPLFPAALGRAERQVRFCRPDRASHCRSMRLSNESTLPTSLCFLELGSRCRRPKQTEDRMDLSLTLPCVASGKAAANIRSSEFPCRLSLKLKEQKFTESPLSLAEMCALRGRLQSGKSTLTVELERRISPAQQPNAVPFHSLHLTAMCKRIAEPLTCGPTVSFHTRRSPRLNSNLCLSQAAQNRG